MNVAKWAIPSFLLALGFLGTFAGSAEAQGPRQYYGNKWYSSGTGYSYRHYYYKPHSGYSGYKHHYAIYYPSRPRYIYYYNPTTRVYWGRYDSVSKGYSMLAPEARKGSLAEICESAFPRPIGMPTIPGSSDGTIMDRPPDDLPPAG